jgi:HTH-type transcriptional regulator/antitoxin HigA
MDIRPVRAESDYAIALDEIATLMVDDPMLGTPDGDRLDVLTTLVQAYEAQHHPVPPPDPIEAIKFRMEQQGLTVADMKPYIWPPHRVREVLERKRNPSLGMIRRLHRGLGIPAESLIGIVKYLGYE